MARNGLPATVPLCRIWLLRVRLCTHPGSSSQSDMGRAGIIQTDQMG
jgi:hypothetical protein